VTAPPRPSSRDRARRRRPSRARTATVLLLALLPALGASTGATAVPAASVPTSSTAASAAAPAPAPPGSAPVGAARPAGVAGARWSWPVPAPHPVLRPFVAPEHAWSPGHRGVDVGAAPGTVVTAPDSGVVHFSRVVVDRPVLSLRHADGVLSSFEPVTSDLAAGTPVERGQPVGELAAGHCAGPPCVHLGARVDGDYVSPLAFLGEARPSVLLPTRR